MKPDPFKEMQKAVDIIEDSPHPTNKIASCIFGKDQNNKDFSIAKTNYWPKIIADKLGKEIKIGNSSGTIHAETAAIMDCDHTNGASIAITDPFCPNCAKNIAESGIKTIYIDHKGFKKDFWERREHVFNNMSMRIAEKAGISVYEIWRKEEKIVPILEIPDDYIPIDENPIEINKIESATKENFNNIIEMKSEFHAGRKHSIIIAKDLEENIVSLTARAHPTIGYCYIDNKTEIENPQGKYSFILEPMNRLLINCRKQGLIPRKEYIYCSQVPTSREQVNMIGAGIDKVIINDKTKARDEHAFKAMALLIYKDIIKFKDHSKI